MTTLDLSSVAFDNDVYQLDCSRGTVIFYSVDESIKEGACDIPIKRVLVELDDYSGETFLLSSIIGLESHGIRLYSEDSSLEGAVLDSSNINRCLMEIQDE